MLVWVVISCTDQLLGRSCLLQGSIAFLKFRNHLSSLVWYLITIRTRPSPSISCFRRKRLRRTKRLVILACVCLCVCVNLCVVVLKQRILLQVTQTQNCSGPLMSLKLLLLWWQLDQLRVLCSFRIITQNNYAFRISINTKTHLNTKLENEISGWNRNKVKFPIMPSSILQPDVTTHSCIF